MADKQVLIQTLKETIVNLNDLEQEVGSFNGDEQSLRQKIVNLVEQLAKLQQQQASIDNIVVPLELLRYLDEGGNPDTFTTQVFTRALQDNQLAKGKVEAVKLLQTSVLAKLQENAPTIAEQWRSTS